MRLVLLAGGMLPLFLQAGNVQDEHIMWFSLGVPLPGTNGGVEAEVYYENEWLDYQTRTLSFLLQPRWFRTAVIPNCLEDVPLSDQGTSLVLRITKTTNGLLRFLLRVRSTKRDVWREIEHRNSNITPFLFTFFADRRPVRALMSGQFANARGINTMTKLARKGEAYETELTICPDTIFDLAGGVKIKELSVVAAFGEYQHEFPRVEIRKSLRDFYANRRPWFSEDYLGPPILIRSDIVRLRHSPEKWEAIPAAEPPGEPARTR